MLNRLICILALSLFVAESRNMIIRERIDPEAVANYTEANFTTYIDHYSAFDQMYNFRYFTDAQYFNNATGGPLLFYCGNEGAIEMFI